MASFADVRAASAPLAGGAPGLLRLVCTGNPFYVLSAGLFLAGLYVSFTAPAGEVETWALMSGLAGYTLLMATNGEITINPAIMAKAKYDSQRDLVPIAMVTTSFLTNCMVS